MRLHALWHVAGITIFVLYFLFCLSRILSTMLEDTSPYVLSKEELAVTDPEGHPNGNGAQLIPKIIHQVYLGWDNKTMPAHWIKAQKSCLDMHPDYEYILWSNETATELLEKEYPWFLPTYRNYQYHVQRADSIRYFILARYGGVYIDLDNGCNRNLGPLLSYPAWMPGTTNRMGLTNHIMGTVRNHPYFQMLIENLESYDHKWLLPYLTIMNSAGPHFVSMVWDDYLKRSPPDEEVRILSWEGYDPVISDWSFFTKEEGGTWHHWDTQAFAWAGQHVIFVGIVVFCCICAGVSCMWWMGWSLALFVDANIRGGRGSRIMLWQKAD